MRFFVTGEQNRHRLMNTIVLLFLGYMILQWVTFGLMYFHRMNLMPASVIAYYLGDPSRYTEPRTYQSLLEVSHAHLFAMGMLAVTLTHLLLFTEIKTRVKVSLSLLVFFSAVGDELSGWLVRFAHPWFAWVKIAFFLTLETSLFVLIVLVTSALLKQRRKVLQPKPSRHVRHKKMAH